MKAFIHWLGKNKLIAVLLAIVVYFCIVSFHDEITTLAIKLRNAIGRDRYNNYLAYGFLVLLLVFLALLFYKSLKGPHRILKTSLSIIVTALMVVSFRLLMVYSIEAIHFVEYMIVAILLVPVLRSYGETVFWVTLLGILDELFQYRYLTPTFEYFDFNDITLNLIGAGAGVLVVFVFCGNAFDLLQIKWYKSPAILTGLGLLAVFFILLLTGKMTIDPPDVTSSENWFFLNRKTMPDEFWTTAYPGRVFHILKPFEGIILMYLILASFFMLDVFTPKDERMQISDRKSKRNR
jgi:hypothetical protein